MRLPSKLRAVLAIVFIAPVMLYLVVLAAFWAYQDELMFQGRSADVLQTPRALNWAFEEVWAEVAGGRTHGWWIPVENARGAVLFSHGSGKNISHYLDDAAYFRELGYSVLLYDYGGYGESTGAPSETRCYADIRAMWQHLREVRGLPADQIVLAGASMGGGVTADLAAEVTPRAVVLECTFTSVPDAVADSYPWLPARLIARIQFRNKDKVGHIQCPVLVIHSLDDTVVPFAHARRLYEMIRQPKKFVEIRGSHGGGKFSSREAYFGGLKAFLVEQARD